MEHHMELIVNGRRCAVSNPDETLVWYLRDELGLKGVRFGCGIGACGCCTVLQGGRAMRSCVVRVRDAGAGELRTLEGLAAPDATRLTDLHPVQRAFIEHPLQCGWCLPGHIMTAVDLLTRNPNPSPAEIETAAGQNLCRCGGYDSIKKAVARAAEIAQESRNEKDKQS
jgi:aerobic-type carbon monoxide dehydrogenase small subunit (CoxS/CutS family)